MVSFLVLVGTMLAAVGGTSLRQASAISNKSGFVAQLFIALLLPLLGYFLYLRIGYRTWSWSPFAYGSLLPIILVALGSLAALFLLLRPQHLSVFTKCILLFSCAVAWVLLLLVGSFAIAYSVGDSL